MFYDNFIRACKIKKQKPNPVAMQCGGTKSSATSWKNGASPNSDIVAKIAEYLEVSTDFLLLGKETVDDLSLTEKELINSFRKLSPNEQQRIIGRCEEIVSSKDKAEPEIIEIAARSKKRNTPKISTDEY
jgi:hypothetical protein|nr:MAG TPA: repressor protein [Caudoviricetes sp.]